MEPTSFLQFGALGVLAFVVMFGCWGLYRAAAAAWAYFTDPDGPVERFVGANADFVRQQGECNRELIAAHGATSTSVQQLRRAGRRAIGAAREIADKLDLSDVAKQSLREAEAELDGQ